MAVTDLPDNRKPRMKIYKYPIQEAFVHNGITFHAPGASYLCHAGLDPSGNPCVWAIVEPGQFPAAEIRVTIYGTGHDIPDGLDMAHFSSYVDGPFVWHVFAAIGYGED